MNEKLSALKNKAIIASVPVLACGMIPISAFAAVGDVPADTTSITAMTTAFTAIQTDFVAMVAKVGPIAISIAGVFLIWRYGLRFFRSVSR